jgi:hypothetical protein
MKSILGRVLLMVLGVSALCILGGCASSGVARLPSTDKIFITTADEEYFVAKKDLVIPYQPVGFLQYQVTKCAPCSPGIAGRYTSLEEAINQELVDLAKNKLQADAAINFQSSVTSTFDITLLLSAQAPYFAALLPCAYIFNMNMISMKAVAVKKKTQ